MSQPFRHHIRLFVGPRAVLDSFVVVVPAARLYALSPGSEIDVLPFDADIQDALHRANGTGEWSEAGDHSLSTRDMSFAADASRAGPLGWIETDYEGVTGNQSAGLWISGAVSLKLATLDTAAALQRPPGFWPANAVLRGLGVQAAAGIDEFTAFGLRHWASNEAIHAGARPVDAT